ncbi:MAG: hypothetical protein ACO1RT_14710 [Planctomycetaceae bacterium]
MNHVAHCQCGPVIVGLLVALLATNLDRCAAAETASAKDNVPAAELSVAPSSHREFPAERPEWVDAPQSRVGDVDRVSVTSTPCRSESLCEEALRVSMRATLETYIESLTGVEESSGVVVFDDQWIDRHRDDTRTYLGSIKTGDGVMYESATVLAFDEADRRLIQQRWQRHQVGQRLAVLGATGGFAAVALIGMAAALSMVTRRAELRVSR